MTFHSLLNSCSGIETGLQVVQNVCDIFQDHRESDQPGVDPRGQLLSFRKLSGGGGSRMHNERAYVSEVCHEFVQRQRLGKLLTCVLATNDIKSDDAGSTVWQQLLGTFVIGRGLQ